MSELHTTDKQKRGLYLHCSACGTVVEANAMVSPDEEAKSVCLLYGHWFEEMEYSHLIDRTRTPRVGVGEGVVRRRRRKLLD